MIKKIPILFKNKEDFSNFVKNARNKKMIPSKTKEIQDFCELESVGTDDFSDLNVFLNNCRLQIIFNLMNTFNTCSINELYSGLSQFIELNSSSFLEDVESETNLESNVVLEKIKKDKSLNQKFQLALLFFAVDFENFDTSNQFISDFLTNLVN